MAISDHLGQQFGSYLGGTDHDPRHSQTSSAGDTGQHVKRTASGKRSKPKGPASYLPEHSRTDSGGYVGKHTTTAEKRSRLGSMGKAARRLVGR